MLLYIHYREAKSLEFVSQLQMYSTVLSPFVLYLLVQSLCIGTFVSIVVGQYLSNCTFCEEFFYWVRDQGSEKLQFHLSIPFVHVFSFLVEKTNKISGALDENHKYCVFVHYRRVEEEASYVLTCKGGVLVSRTPHSYPPSRKGSPPFRCSLNCL